MGGKDLFRNQPENEGTKLALERVRFLIIVPVLQINSERLRLFLRNDEEEYVIYR